MKIIKKFVESKNKNKGGKMERKKTIKKFQNRFLTYQKPKKLFKTFAIIAWLLAAGAILTLGGNVVVKDGGLNVTDDFFVSTDVLFVDTTNNKVGIGTTTPNEKLTVVGNVNITENITIGDKLTFAFSEFIDNLVDGWLRITGSLNVTGDLNVIGNITGGSPVKIKGGLNVLNASGTTQLYVNDTTGYVGVGTTSPGRPLHVVGGYPQIRAEGTDAAVSLVDNAQTHEWWLAAGYSVSNAFEIRDITNSATRLLIDNSGNIGIGETSKLSRLTVKGSASGTLTGGANVTNQSTTITCNDTSCLFTSEVGLGDRVLINGSTKTITAIASDTSMTADSVFTANATDQSITRYRSQFRIDDSSGNVDLVVQDNGNVGIGTTGPGAKLDIRDDTGLHLGAGQDLQLTVSSDNIYFKQATQDKDIYFQVNDGGSTTTPLFIDGSTSRVGIGTTSPEDVLHVEGNSASSTIANFFNDGNNANRYGLNIQVGADDASGTNQAIIFRDGDGTNQGNIVFTTGTVTYNAFTAGHDVSVPEKYNENGYPYGTLMCIKSLYYHEKQERGIRYNVEPCSSPYSKTVLGAYSGKYDNEDLHIVYVLGDGHILVNSENGNIAIGDPITTSSTTGIGMKATKIGMVIGYAQENIDFTDSEPKLVAVQYVLDYYVPEETLQQLNELESLKQRISALEAQENDELQAQIKQLREAQ